MAKNERSIAYLRPQVEPIEGIKAPVCRSVVLVAEAKVPLPYGMGGVARLLEVLRHDVHIGGQPSWHERLDVHVLTSYSDTQMSMTPGMG